jgi:hypothetical protein
MDLPTSSDFLGDARRDFPQFYATATAFDEMLLDNLVRAHAALVVGTNTPRKFIAPQILARLERQTDVVERVFTDLREMVRSCPTFRALPVDEQLHIEHVIFDVRPPLFEET